MVTDHSLKIEEDCGHWGNTEARRKFQSFETEGKKQSILGLTTSTQYIL